MASCTKRTKRPRPEPSDGNPEPTAEPHGQKRRKQNTTAPEFKSQEITTVRQLGNLVTDLDDLVRLDAGINSFRKFLRCCAKGGETEDDEVDRCLRILKEYLEVESKNSGLVEEGQEGDAFRDLLQVWSWASQGNKSFVQCSITSTLAALIHLCSQNDELKNYGVILAKTILQQSYLKIVYRSLTSGRDHVVSPCLRVLTEINRFSEGSLCGALHRAFDFSTKDLTRSLEIRGKVDVTKAEDLRKPSVRTVCVRFLLSFLQNGSPTVKSEVLELRSWMNTLWKHLRTDTPSTISDVLDTFSKKVIADQEISRSIKTSAFTGWVLGHIAALYSRSDSLKFTVADIEVEKPVSQMAHDFLLFIATKPGSGVCFPDNGWYPPGSSETEAKSRGAPKVNNRTLSSFLSTLKPFSDILQQDLLLGIFKAKPELIADYFLSNTAFSFEPKLTSTWVGYCTFLSAVVQLSIPENFGLKDLSAFPPPVATVVENILPQPLNKLVLTKCLSHENGLIKLLSTRLITSSFQKLRKVLAAFDTASASMVDPTSSWTKPRIDLIEEFCRRVPDIGSVVATCGSGKSQGVFQSEAGSRLLAEYYEVLPEVAQAGKFDVNVALGTLLAAEGKVDGMKFLEMVHLLRVAKDVPDVKWWNKSASMPFSPFVSVLKLCCNPSSTIPLQQIRALLHSFVSSSLLFQTETPAPPLEALLESLSSIPTQPAFTAVLSFLDGCVAHCIRSPFKYTDDYAELALETLKSGGSGEEEEGSLPAVSPFLMTIVEQWKFFMDSRKEPEPESVKKDATDWLARFIGSCAIIGENKFVLIGLCNRLMAACNGSVACEKVFKGLKKHLQSSKGLELVYTSDADADSDPDAMVLDDPATLSKPKTLRSLFLPDLAHLNLQIAKTTISLLNSGKLEVSLFDIAIVQHAILGLVKSSSGGVKKERVLEGIEVLYELFEALLKKAKNEAGGGEILRRARGMVAVEVGWVRLFLTVPGQKKDDGAFERDVVFSEGYSRILCLMFDGYDPVLKGVNDRIKNSAVEIGVWFDGIIDDSYKDKILTIYESTIGHLFSQADISEFITILTHPPAPPGNLTFKILTTLVQKTTSIPTADLERLLTIANAPEPLSIALGKYVTTAPISTLQTLSLITLQQFSPVDEETTSSSPGEVALRCALIRRIESMQKIVITFIIKSLGKKKNSPPPETLDYLTALLEVSSVPALPTTTTTASGRFTWSPQTSQKTKENLEKIFSAAQEEFFAAGAGSGAGSGAGAAQVELLQRAASLFPSLDRRRVLKRIAGDNRRSSLSGKTVVLIETLLESMDNEGEDGGEGAEELSGWFLMVFDHLTRQFAEDEGPRGKDLEFVRRLGELLSRGRFDLKAIPRATVNLVLEVALQKHIHVAEVTYFCTVIVSRCSAQSLDLSKHLQIILNHPLNPLSTRCSTNGTPPSPTHYHISYLIHHLFTLSKSSQSNITTLDGAIGLYRGSNDLIDSVLLEIIKHIEAHLARSCATRIASWSILENANGKPLATRNRARKINISIDAKTLLRSIFNYSPNKQHGAVVSKEEEEEGGGLDGFMDLASRDEKLDSYTYDPAFMIPALTYCLVSKEEQVVVVDVQAVVERHCLGFAIMGLCSREEEVRIMAVGYINAFVAKLENSPYREKTQLLHLLSTLHFSLLPPTTTTSSSPPQLPTITTLFLSHSLQILTSPTHHLYERTMKLLLRRPLIDLQDLPQPLSNLTTMVETEEYHKELLWDLTVLVSGIKTEVDLEIYRKRRVFEFAMAVYKSPYVAGKVRGLVVELLWNAAGVEGGGTTLVTRNAVLGWVEEVLVAGGGRGGGDEEALKRLGGRLFEGCAKGHVEEWSRGNLKRRLVEGVFDR